MPDDLRSDAAAANRASAVEAIVRRAETLTGPERLRLGRWTSASLRDPRVSPGLEAARERAIAILDAIPERRRRWDRASRPLHDALVAGAGGLRRWRIAVFAGHLAALAAIASIPGGLPASVALAIGLLAPLSAWTAWGRGLAPLGAIHAALAAAASDRLDADDLSTLRASWQKSIELDPPARPPLLGMVGSLIPSALLLAVFGLIVASGPR